MMKLEKWQTERERERERGGGREGGREGERTNERFIEPGRLLMSNREMVGGGIFYVHKQS